MSELVDRFSLARNRARAARAPELFLQERAALDLQERLEEVNRTFTAPAIITPWPQIWQEIWPEAKIIPDDERLDLRAQAHDLVIHALALHWANDPVGQLIQCRAALRPDGLLLASLFGGQTLAELRAALAEAEAAQTGGLSPRVLPMGEIRDLGGLLSRAGFALPVADAAQLTVRYESLFHLMRDLRAMGESNALTGRLRRPTRPGLFAQAAALYAQRHGGTDGRIPASFEIVTLTGWAPDASQQKPLAPGSASHKLADILADLKAKD